MKIVIMEPLGISDNALENLLKNLKLNNEVISYKEKTTNNQELIKRADGADAIIIANNPLSGEVIKSLSNLKMISVAFVGIDHIDVDVCKKQNIRISNAAGYCTNAVAELAIGLTLSVLRNIPKCDTAARNLSNKNGLVGNELFSKTFGIIGTGAIGLKTAEFAKVFGCKVLAYSRTQKESALNLGVEYVSLDKLLSESDIISIHTPLTKETKYLLNSSKLDLMKSTAILINTARGPIVDNEYLAELLAKGKIAGAGIDVFDIEPPLRLEDTLINQKNAVLTPHIAYATEESILRRASIVISNIELWMENKLQNIML